MAYENPIGPGPSVIGGSIYPNPWQAPVVTKEVVTVEEYDKDGKLVKRTITETTRSQTNQQPYIYNDSIPYGPLRATY